MKRVIALLLFICAELLGSCPVLAQQKSIDDVWVRPYTRSDGVSVKGHWRSAPNDTQADNFSRLGNVNPYTGESGWIPDYDLSNEPPAGDNSWIKWLAVSVVVFLFFLFYDSDIPVQTKKNNSLPSPPLPKERRWKSEINPWRKRNDVFEKCSLSECDAFSLPASRYSESEIITIAKSYSATSGFSGHYSLSRSGRSWNIWRRKPIR